MTLRDRTARAQELLIQHPDWGRRSVNRQLRSEFGHGLRDTTIDNMSRSMNRTPTLRARVNTKGAFTLKERRVLKHAIRQSRNIPYVIKAINDRFAIFLQGQREGWTLKQYKAAVRQYYKDNGWIATSSSKDKKDLERRVKGYPDVWKMLRDIREQMIHSGEFDPSTSDAFSMHRPHPKPNKGDILAQKKRHREREKVSTRERDRQWAAELRDTMRRHPERRLELEPQLERILARIGR